MSFNFGIFFLSGTDFSVFFYICFWLKLYHLGTITEELNTMLIVKPSLWTYICMEDKLQIIFELTCHLSIQKRAHLTFSCF